MNLHLLQLLLVVTFLMMFMTGCASYQDHATRWNWYQRTAQVEDNASQLLRKNCAGLNREVNQDFYKLESE